MPNPFVFGKVITGESFIDREQDLVRLTGNISNHINTTLISPRRWGKSSLVANVGKSLSTDKETIRFCYLDLFNIRTEEEFYIALTSELIRATFDRWDKWQKAAKQFFKKLSPKFTVVIDPIHDFSISLDWEELSKSPDEILNLPEQFSDYKKVHIVVCIDEFQNIAFFREASEFQKKLRAHWQHHQKATYVIYGSKRHMMLELFNNPSMPFYKFGDLILLEKIAKRHWVDFICSGFQKTGKFISESLAGRIAGMMENHPYFVQQLAHETWNLSDKECDDHILDQAVTSLLEKNSLLFLRDLDLLTNMQVNFLKALAKEIKQFSSYPVLKEYHLGTSGNVNRIKTALESKEIIDILPDRIEFLDPLFKYWFKTIYLKR